MGSRLEKLEKLKVLLLEEKKHLKVVEEEQKLESGVEKPTREQLIEVARKVWTRPIDPKLYTCPISEPQTTLVKWSSLTRPIQDQLLASKPSHQDDVVEIPLAILQPPTDNTGSTRRPLSGNLSDKLSEYTRGVTGQSRPFRPGGLGQEDVANQEEDPYRTEEAIRQAQLPLTQGIEQSWKDGSLITAPPGATFRVGISWKDIYGVDLELAKDEKAVALEQNTPSQEYQEVRRSMPTSLDTTQGLFSRDFFEEDSLFGSSSSDSDDGSEADEEDESAQEDGSEKDASEEVQLDTSPEVEVVENDENLDDLLTQLTLSDHGIFQRKKKTSDETAKNPLELAAQQTQNQLNAARKTWASTQLLPIRDFHETVPNPAMQYPFTLDGFQQQAIARLERAESVFVSCHTSAGKTVGKWCRDRFLWLFNLTYVFADHSGRICGGNG